MLVEAGRDYNSTWIPRELLWDLYLPPFKAGVEAGAQTVMAAFTALNGLPATANPLTLDHILKGMMGLRRHRDFGLGSRLGTAEPWCRT